MKMTVLYQKSTCSPFHGFHAVVGRQKHGLVVTQSQHQAGCAGTDLQRSGLGDPDMWKWVLGRDFTISNWILWNFHMSTHQVLPEIAVILGDEGASKPWQDLGWMDLQKVTESQSLDSISQVRHLSPRLLRWDRHWRVCGAWENLCLNFQILLGMIVAVSYVYTPHKYMLLELTSHSDDIKKVHAKSKLCISSQTNLIQRTPVTRWRWVPPCQPNWTQLANSRKKSSGSLQDGGWSRSQDQGMEKVFGWESVYLSLHSFFCWEFSHFKCPV